MKKFLILLALAVNFILWGAIFMIGSEASAQISQVVNMTQPVAASSSLESFYTWLEQNWTIVALVVSEAAALLPVKVNGIVQGVIRMFSGLFGKREKA